MDDLTKQRNKANINYQKMHCCRKGFCVLRNHGRAMIFSGIVSAQLHHKTDATEAIVSAFNTVKCIQNMLPKVCFHSNRWVMHITRRFWSSGDDAKKVTGYDIFLVEINHSLDGVWSS
jgi:hypothetical protein